MSINWKKQWEDHAPTFKNGQAHIPLPGGKTFPLDPGPGFGDYSHPTTQLMLAHMPPLVKNKPVVDIGCGSGILSIAAAHLGAASVHGIDICPLALTHAKQNAALNHLALAFSSTHHTSTPSIYLMNMIPLEQQDAIKAVSPAKGSLFLISGLLAKKPYTPPLLLTPIARHTKGEWACILMKH